MLEIILILLNYSVLYDTSISYLFHTCENEEEFVSRYTSENQQKYKKLNRVFVLIMAVILPFSSLLSLVSYSYLSICMYALFLLIIFSYLYGLFRFGSEFDESERFYNVMTTCSQIGIPLVLIFRIAEFFNFLKIVVKSYIFVLIFKEILIT